jgi:hypothetical protein
MALPWTNVTSRSSLTSRTNKVYGAALFRTYPRGVFFASNTYGAPGQPAVPRVMPTAANPTLDPRTAGGGSGYFNMSGRTNLQRVVGAPNASAPSNTVLIGGNSYNTTTADYGPYVIMGVLAVVVYFIFFR